MPCNGMEAIGIVLIWMLELQKNILLMDSIQQQVVKVMEERSFLTEMEMTSVGLMVLAVQAIGTSIKIGLLQKQIRVLGKVLLLVREVVSRVAEHLPLQNFLVLQALVRGLITIISIHV